MRQAVPHVEQRLLVHRLVLERREDRLTPPHGAVLAAREIEGGALERIDDGLVRAPAKSEHFLARRPARSRAAARHRLIDAVGIDAALEEPLEIGIDAGEPESAPQQGNHAERREVPLVEHDGIAQRDRTRVIGVGIDEIEQLARSGAVALIPVDELRAIDGDDGSGERQGVPFQRGLFILRASTLRGPARFRRRRPAVRTSAAYPHPDAKSQPDRGRAGQGS